MIALIDITTDDFKAYFDKGFPYYPGEGCPDEFVTDSDIQKAFDEAQINFNVSLFADDQTVKIAYLYLTAHYLCNDLQTAAQGIQSVGYNHVTSRGVGSVSESYQIPEWVIKDPILSSYAMTRYGQKYLSIIRPLLVGNAVVYQGATTFM